MQPDVNTLTRNAADKAYELAGVGPEDLDLVELHDCFATAELIHYDNLRLCEPGGAGEFINQWPADRGRAEKHEGDDHRHQLFAKLKEARPAAADKGKQ